MLENGKISMNQFIILIVMFTLGTSALIAPPLVVEEAKQDAWLSTIISMIMGLLLAWLFGTLASRYPDLTIIQSSEKILGKWIGKSLSLLYFFFHLILTAGLLHIIGDLLITHILTDTPIQIIEITFMLTIIFGVRLGLETFARTSQMLFPYVILFFILLIIFLIPQIKLEHLSPILENGVNQVLRGSFPLLGVPFLDMIVFLMITPYTNTPKKVRKSMIIATLISSVVLIFLVLLSLTVLGANLTSRLNYPMYDLAQKIEIGDFIRRIEILAGGVMFLSIFIKITICFFSLVLSFAQIFHINHHQCLTFPLGMITFGLVLILFPDNIFFHLFVSKAWTPIMLIYGVAFPCLLLFVDLFKIQINNWRT